jgi:hypothetical protein
VTAQFLIRLFQFLERIIDALYKKHLLLFALDPKIPLYRQLDDFRRKLFLPAALIRYRARLRRRHVVRHIELRNDGSPTLGIPASPLPGVKSKDKSKERQEQDQVID